MGFHLDIPASPIEAGRRHHNPDYLLSTGAIDDDNIMTLRRELFAGIGI